MDPLQKQVWILAGVLGGVLVLLTLMVLGLACSLARLSHTVRTRRAGEAGVGGGPELAETNMDMTDLGWGGKEPPAPPPAARRDQDPSLPSLRRPIHVTYTCQLLSTWDPYFA